MPSTTNRPQSAAERARRSAAWKRRGFAIT